MFKSCHYVVGAAEYPQYLGFALANIAQIVRSQYRYQRNMAFRQHSLFPSDTYLYCTFQDQKQFLGAIGMLSEIFSRLQFEVNSSCLARTVRPEQGKSSPTVLGGVRNSCKFREFESIQINGDHSLIFLMKQWCKETGLLNRKIG